MDTCILKYIRIQILLFSERIEYRIKHMQKKDITPDETVVLNCYSTPPNLLDSALTGFYLFPKLKTRLPCNSVGSVQDKREEIAGSIPCLANILCEN